MNQRQDFACVSIIIIVTCLLMKKKSKSLKPIKKIPTFQLSFVLESYLKKLMLLNYRRYDFSVDCNDILNIITLLQIFNG